MKRFLSIFIISTVVLGSLTAETKSVGGGISVFVPETLYLYGDGTLAFEQGLSYSFGFGDVLSFPIGFAYHAADGFVLNHSALKTVNAAVLYGDSLIPYLMLKTHFALGSMFYIEGFGGGALDWAFSLKPTKNFAQTLIQAQHQQIAVDSVDITKGVGYGWLAGGAFGVKVGAISVDLGGTYRWLTIPVSIETSLVRVNSDNTVVRESVKFSDATAVMRGVSVQLAGSYAF